MPQQQFQPGDVVELKSGGPKMTVAYRDDRSQIEAWWCVWLDKDARPQLQTFPAATLRSVPTQP